MFACARESLHTARTISATVVAGLFPDDGLPPPALPSTSVGWTHLVAGMVAFPSFLLGPLFLTIGLRRGERCRDRVPVLLGVVAALAASVIWFGVIAAPRNMAGLAQRVLLALLLLWLFLVSRALAAKRRQPDLPSSRGTAQSA